MAEYFDTLEIRDPEERERAQLARLPRQAAYAKAHAPGSERHHAPQLAAPQHPDGASRLDDAVHGSVAARTCAV